MARYCRPTISMPLMATPDGGLWISFRPSGLGFLKDGELKIFTRPEEIPTSPVYCFARTPEGKIWAGTHDGLSLFNGVGWDAIGADWNIQPNSVKTLFTDRSGTLWVSQEDSISFLPLGAKTFQQSEKTDKDMYPNQFGQARDGRLWAARLDREVSPIKSPLAGPMAKNPVLKIGSQGLIFDRDGCLWVGSGNTVNRISFPEQLESVTLHEDDGSPFQTFNKSDGLSDTSAGKLFEDREGNIWVGSLTGIDRFRYSAVIPIVLPDVNKKLTLSAGEQGDIWAGSATVGSFVHLFEGKVEKVFLTPKEIPTSSFYRDTDGSAWWGTSGGIWHQQNKDFKFFPQPKDLGEEWIWEIFRGENDGGLWVNYGDLGLIYFKDGVWEKRQPPAGLPDRGPSASFEDEKKRIWLGYTENRVCFLDGGRVQCYSSANGIEIGRIKVIRGRGGSFWFGGELGLSFFKNDRFYTVKTDGKPFGTVSGIIATENGDVWLNEAHGIVNIPADEIRRLNEDPEYAVKYRLFDFLDNLPGNPQMNYTVSTAVETPDKRLWFATDNGLAVIDPTRLEKNEIPPSVIIKSVSADQQQFQPGQLVPLPAGTSNLHFSYTATSLSIPERVKFKYRLNGYEDEWRDAGTRREAFYTHLGPGKYHFQVIASNNDGVWNEQGASLDFEILPLFYQTNWFLLMCVGAVAVLGFAAYQWRLYHVKSRLQFQFGERLAERTRIAQDLHDTLLQGVVSAAMQLDVATERLGKKSPAKPMLDHINGLMASVITEGRNALKGLRSQTVNYLSDLEMRFSQIRREMDIAGQIDFRTTVTGQPRPLLSVVGEETHQICREALTNAFRHSGATVIEVEIEYGARHFMVVVRDNGQGIDPKVVKSGREGHYGLSGMRERADSIEGQLKVYSRAEGGTEVELIVPGRFAYDTQISNIPFRWLSSLSRRKSKPGKEVSNQ